MRDYAVGGTIQPPLAATYPLRELARAQRDFMSKDFIGKRVIKMPEAA